MLVVYSPENCLKYSKKLKTISDAIYTEAPTLSTITKMHNKEFVEGLVMVWLVYVNRVLNLSRPMTEEQIEICAVDIVAEFYFLKMTDLTFIFKRIISGYYGDFYERINIDKVKTIFREYFDERCNAAEEQSIRSHRDTTSDDTFNFSKNIKRLLQDKSKHSK